MNTRLVAALACALTFAPPASAQETASPDAEGVCVASFEAAQTERQEGKLIAARGNLEACSAKTCPGPIVEKCLSWLEEVDKELPSVVIAVKDASGADVLDVRVMRGEEELAAVLDGKPIELDPGSYRLSLIHGDAPPFEIEVVVRTGEKNKPVDAVLPARPAPHDAVEPAPVPVPAPDPDPGDDGEGSSLLPLAWIGFGLAGAGAIVGGITGGLAISRHNELEEQCPTTGCTQDDIDGGRVLAHVSTASFAIAGAGAVLGVVILVATLGADEESGPGETATTITPILSPTFVGANVIF